MNVKLNVYKSFIGRYKLRPCAAVFDFFPFADDVRARKCMSKSTLVIGTTTYELLSIEMYI